MQHSIIDLPAARVYQSTPVWFLSLLIDEVEVESFCIEEIITLRYQGLLWSPFLSRDPRSLIRGGNFKQLSPHML